MLHRMAMKTGCRLLVDVDAHPANWELYTKERLMGLILSEEYPQSIQSKLFALWKRIAGGLFLWAERGPLGRLSLAGLFRHWAQIVLYGMMPNPMEINGYKLYFHRAARSTAWTFYRGDYERETTETVRSLLKPGMTFVDLGANLGYFTILASRLVEPEGRVYAFEPEPALRDSLTRNVQANDCSDTAVVVPKAVSDTCGTALLHLNELYSGAYSLFPTRNTTNTVEIETVTSDAFFQGLNWPTVDLLKMDVEGAEYHTLVGMRELLRRNPGAKLIVEFTPATLARNGIAPEALLELLKELGLTRISALHHTPLFVDLRDGIGTEELVRLARSTCLNLLCEREEESPDSGLTTKNLFAN
ncbi:MAG: FkbM family methyltransferase [Dehalococcoidia bacterium]